MCRPAWRTVENETRLLNSVLEGIVTGSQVRRVESQLMMLLPCVPRTVPGAEYLAAYERNFMLLDFDVVPLPPDRPARSRILTEKWSDHHQESAAQLIAAAYTGHIDSHINDQYRSVIRRATFPLQHRAISRLRHLLPLRILRALRSGSRLSLRPFAGQHRRPGIRDTSRKFVWRRKCEEPALDTNCSVTPS